MSHTKLETQSFVLTLDDDTYAPIKINLTNKELEELYSDDAHLLTQALIRELAMNLKASKDVEAEYIAEKEELMDANRCEVNDLEELIDDLSLENHKLRSDNEMLRDEIDGS